MTATFALIRDTFREAFARKVFWGFFGCCTALLLFFIFLMRVDVVAGATATVSLFGKTSPGQDVTKIVKGTQGFIAAFMYVAGIALAVFASAGLVSAMFEPGRIELLLSKPVSRTHLLLGRFAGNVLVVASNVLYLTVGTWLIFGIKTDVWGTGFLLSSLWTIFMFTTLLTVIVLVGVLFDSGAVAIMVTFAIMIITPVLAQKDHIEKLLSSEWSRDLLRVMYYALPKFSDGAKLVHHLIVNEPVTDWMPLWSTAIFGAVMLGLAIWRFERRTF